MEDVPGLAHIEALLAEMDRRYQQQFDAAEKAVVKAEVAMEKRFDALNEFRLAYQDLIANKMSRAEAEQRLNALAEKIDDLKGSSRAGAASLWAWLVGAAGLAATVIALFRK